MDRSLKKRGASDQDQTRFKKKVQYQGEYRSAKFMVDEGGKPTCAKCGKRHYCECLFDTGSYFGYGKDGHNVRDCPMIASRGKKDKKVAPSGPKEDAPTKRHFNELRSRVEKPDEKESDDDVCKFCFFC